MKKEEKSAILFLYLPWINNQKTCLTVVFSKQHNKNKILFEFVILKTI